MAAAVMVVCATFAASCDYQPYHATTKEETEEANALLRSLPSLEDTEALAERVIEQTTATATQLDPAVKWYWTGEQITGGCHQPFDYTDGMHTVFQTYMSHTPISDAAWPQVADKIRSIMVGTGIVEDPKSYKNQPGINGIRFSHESGTEINIRTITATKVAAIDVDTGCRLPRSPRTSTSPTSWVLPTPVSTSPTR
jgi:hypothetical protein